MFTGIVEGLGTITGIQSSGQGSSFSLTADFNLEGTKIGDSLAVNALRELIGHKRDLKQKGQSLHALG